MPLTLLTGPPGAGKTAHAIDRLEAADRTGRSTFAIVCADLARSSATDRHLRAGRFASRNGRSWVIDALLTEADLSSSLAGIAPDSLVVIEDAYGYSAAVSHILRDASARGLEIIVVAPSSAQQEALARDATIVPFTKPCDRCGQRPGVRPVIEAATGVAATYCEPCFAQASDEASIWLRQVLREGGPHQGTEYLYQPIELPGYEGWKVVRPDSRRRAELMYDAVRRHRSVDDQTGGSFLDIGCLTGYFCDFFASRGFSARGVDVTKTNIEVARTLETFHRRSLRADPVFVIYEQRDAYDYLQATRDRPVDVTSALSVFQWVMLQRDVEAGLDCIRWLAAKTRQVMFLEMGYTEEDLYKDQLPIRIDRAWMEDILHEIGFPTVELIDRTAHGLRRDIYVGIKDE